MAKTKPSPLEAWFESHGEIDRWRDFQTQQWLRTYGEEDYPLPVPKPPEPEYNIELPKYDWSGIGIERNADPGRLTEEGYRLLDMVETPSILEEIWPWPYYSDEFIAYQKAAYRRRK